MAKRARLQLSEEVAAYVRELIIAGEVKPGDFLRLEPIAEAVGVSITPVREALVSLRGEGFVRLAPRRGFVVAPFNHQDVRDLFWVQAQLAGELAARAASTLDQARLQTLADVQSQYEVAVSNGAEDDVAKLGHEFHRQINLGANSYRLAILLSSTANQLPNKFYATIEAHVGATGSEHDRIFEALRAGDEEASRRLMQAHILNGAERLISTLPPQEESASADDEVLSLD